MIVDDRGRQLQVRPLRRLVIREHAGRAGAEPLGALLRRCGRISSRPPAPPAQGSGAARGRQTSPAGRLGTIPGAVPMFSVGVH